MPEQNIIQQCLLVGVLVIILGLFLSMKTLKILFKLTICIFIVLFMNHTTPVELIKDNNKS